VKNSEVEAIVLRAIRQALDNSHLGPADDFFGAGGDSILAVKVTSEVEERLGISLDTMGLYVAPTAAELAALISAGNGEDE